MTTASSIEAYFIEHSAGSSSSLTLCPSGEERSRMRRHLLGRLRLGIMPNGLIWRLGRLSVDAGGRRDYSAQLGFPGEVRIYYLCVLVPRAHVAFSPPTRARPLGPIRKPVRRPRRMYWVNVESGWEAKRSAHASAWRGVITHCREGGRMGRGRPGRRASSARRSSM